MRFRNIFSAAVFALALGFSGVALGQAFPLLEGDLDTCNRIEQAYAEGKSMEDALVAFIQNFDSSDPKLLYSIHRTILYNAIVECEHPPEIVIRASFSSGLPLDMIVQTALMAGVKDFVITATLFNLGVDSYLVANAIDMVDTPLIVDAFLSSPFEVQSGLEPASPFSP